MEEILHLSLNFKNESFQRDLSEIENNYDKQSNFRILDFKIKVRM